MNLLGKTKWINLGILLSFVLFLAGSLLDIKLLKPLGFLALGIIFTIFHREIAAERFRIDKETKNEFLKKYVFASETVERNSFVVLMGGVISLVAGGLMTAAMLLE